VLGPAIAQAIAPLEPRYGEPPARIVAFLENDDRVRALLLTGSVCRGSPMPAAISTCSSRASPRSSPAAVEARADRLLGQVAVANDLLVESNQPLPSMGVEQWSSRLTPRLRDLLRALPAPRAERGSVAAMTAVRGAIRTHGRIALEGAGGTCPAEVDDALAAYREQPQVMVTPPSTMSV
jgi:hypothetical protein